MVSTLLQTNPSGNRFKYILTWHRADFFKSQLPFIATWLRGFGIKADRQCFCSISVLWLNTWLLWSASAQPRRRFLNQNEFVFDSWVWKGTHSHHLPYLRHPQISLQLLWASAHYPGCNHLSTVVEHRPSKTGRAASPVPLPWQFQQINKICNNCFTSNSGLRMQPHFIRLESWLRQRETRQGHKHCVPESV